MKITLNVDGPLLKRVMAAMGTTNKTRAIDQVLRDADRRTKLQGLAAEGMGLSPEELGKMFDPSYDLMAARAAEGLYRTGKRKLLTTDDTEVVPPASKPKQASGDQTQRK
jgi:hypothetical protein